MPHDVKKAGASSSILQPEPAGETLLPIARAAIGKAVGQATEQPPLALEHTSWLQEIRACFVTLTQAGNLRGCIGTLHAHRRLLDDVKLNAVAAALHDPRFAPLSRAELAYTRIEISLLSPMQAMNFGSEADALTQLRPGVDGVVFEFGRYRSTFLPQVWDQLPAPEAFMAQLKQKAGLPPDFWSPDVQLQRYAVSKWQEK